MDLIRAWMDVNEVTLHDRDLSVWNQKLSADWLQHPGVLFAEWVWWNYGDLRTHKQVHKRLFQKVIGFQLKNSLLILQFLIILPNVLSEDSKCEEKLLNAY